MKRANPERADFSAAPADPARRFHLNLRPPPGTELAVVAGGVDHCAPACEVRRETSAFHAVEYVVRGEGRLKLGGRSHELRPGVIFAYGTGVRRHLQVHPEKALVKYFVHFAGSRAAQWIQRAGLAPGHVMQVYPPGEIQPLFDELIRSGQRGARQAPELCRQLLEALGTKLCEARAPRTSADSAAFATYQRCRQFLQEQAHEVRTLEQAARECRLDTAYLCRLFRRFDHQTPYQLLTRMKMNAAAGLLQQPGALVKNVAADLGFRNPFHFSRVFKSVFGVAPETFRGLH